MRVRSDGLGKAELLFKLSSVSSEGSIVYVDGVGYVSRAKWRVKMTLEPEDIPMLLKIALNRHIAKMFLAYLAQKLGLKKKPQKLETYVKKV
ncbi:MAG: hypothetical protein QXN08_08780 [Nitrososphaerales archaeon]